VKLLLVRRTSRGARSRAGGIVRSNTMIADGLRSWGWTVIEQPQESDPPRSRLDENYDVVWIYGGSLGSRDGGVYTELSARGVPVLHNSHYDGRDDTCADITSFFANKPRAVKGVVFTPAALRDPRLATVADRLVVLPKTIRNDVYPGPAFADRSGALLGDWQKATRGRLTGGFSFSRTVGALREALGGARVSVYEQYPKDGLERPEGLDVLPADHSGGFVRTLGTFRYFVSLSVHETFAMVPVEAAACGTVTLYRSSPQSLDYYLGDSGGVLFETVDGLAASVAAIDADASCWAALSGSAVLRAQSQCVRYAEPVMSMALKEVVRGAV